MYVAIAHQLGADSPSVQQLRKTAADFMRSHRDDFMPFMDNVVDDVQFLKYCQETESTAAWGGQLEVRGRRCQLRFFHEVINHLNLT